MTKPLRTTVPGLSKKNKTKWELKKEKLEQNPTTYMLMRRIEDGERRECARFARLVKIDPATSARKFAQLKFPLDKKTKL